MIRPALRGLMLVFLLGIAGCDSRPESNLDEQNDPHFLNGRSRASSQDYKGAVEEFEKALENNPRSASAHFELGWLNEEHMKDYAAAIYHYERHLRLRPNSDYIERAKDRIRSCKMDLVKNEVLAPVNQGMQRDLERLAAENLLLKRQLEALQNQLAAKATIPPTDTFPQPTAEQPTSAPLAARSNPVTTQIVFTPIAPTRSKTHVVKSGETITAIALKYNVRLNVFLAANPKADPRRLKVGQTLTIPSTSP